MMAFVKKMAARIAGDTVIAGARAGAQNNEYSISEEDWKKFFNKNDAVDREVPVALARQVKFAAVARLEADGSMDALEMARVRGMIQACVAYERAYRAQVEETARTVVAGDLQA